MGWFYSGLILFSVLVNITIMFYSAVILKVKKYFKRKSVKRRAKKHSVIIEPQDMHKYQTVSVINESSIASTKKFNFKKEDTSQDLLTKANKKLSPEKSLVFNARSKKN